MQIFYDKEKQDIRNRTSKPLVWIAVVSIIMLFGGLTSAYIVTHSDRFWVNFHLPVMFLYSSAIIILSSITMYMALSSANNNKNDATRIYLLVTMALGFGFMLSQFLAWNELVTKGNFFVGSLQDLKGEYGSDYTILYNGTELIYNNASFYMPGDTTLKEPINEEMFKSFNIASSFLYVLSGLHVAHLTGGIIALLIVTVKSFFNKYHSGNLLGLQMCSIYWHFLDVLWIYLFLFLNFIR